HLKVEFEQRRDRLREAGVIADPREAQIVRLRDQVEALRTRLSDRDVEIKDLHDFKTTAVSRLAAQHDEITRLRAALASRGNVRPLDSGRGRTSP
ncbi:hypothetical protein, partial [Actinokineospora sp.]|uniref:hypothetical protein n=1 Tax=Actinokineospora sp. TaxID=1872133 RepID=UPI003D6AF0D7